MSVENRAVTGSEAKLHFWLMLSSYKLRDFLLSRAEILKEVGIREEFQVLDFGCGPGSYVPPLSRLVGERGMVYALDRNPLAVEAVNKLVFRKRLANVKTILSSCPTGLASESVDVVLLYDVIHHLKARYNVLMELHRVLKSSGILSVSGHHLKRGEIVRVVTEDGLFEISFEGKRTQNFHKSSVTGGKR